MADVSSCLLYLFVVMFFYLDARFARSGKSSCTRTVNNDILKFSNMLKHFYTLLLYNIYIFKIFTCLYFLIIIKKFWLNFLFMRFRESIRQFYSWVQVPSPETKKQQVFWNKTISVHDTFIIIYTYNTNLKYSWYQPSNKWYCQTTQQSFFDGYFS